ncbi:MAG: hypothetical protein WBF13_09135 [Candidatus Zixiibacteriota bacterium]
MPVFDNPNRPRQPKEGVYKWYIKNGPVLYIGAAGKARSGRYKKGSTLFRGISEASLNHGDPGNTNVIVGKAIEYLEKRCGLECHWKHVCDDPSQELDIIQKLGGTLLQGTKRNLKSKQWKHIRPIIRQHVS